MSIYMSRGLEKYFIDWNRFAQHPKDTKKGTFSLQKKGHP